MSANAFMPILRGFAAAVVAPSVYIEREVHHGDELPVGDGWVRIEYDPPLRIAVWERTSVVMTQSVVVGVAR